ncbi:MAG: M20/M25/M40 family metallo-hydrolase [Parcubacteria group bacterium]|nr:M20/M25/M40 family metallo-hydrolase [Parcubacteria group bacterium]
MRNQLVKTFCTFVQKNSPTGSEKEFSNYLKKCITKLHIPVSQDKRGNLLMFFGGHGKSLLLVAHLDTVKPGCDIVPIVKNGIMRSKGKTILGADNKAVVAILFELMRWSRTQKSHRAFEILLSVSEESGVSGIDTLNLTKIHSKEALCFDIAKPFGTIVLSSPYYLRQDLQIRGKEADASTVTQGHSVLPALSKFLKEVPHGVLGNTFCNIGTVHGGSDTNTLLSNIQLQREVRSFTQKNLQKQASLIKWLIKKNAEENGCIGYYTDRLENYGYYFNQHNKFVKHISKSIYQSTHCRIRYYKKYWGVSDANNLNKRGVKTLNLGYGAKNPHTTKESISIKEMEKVFTFLKTIINTTYI